MSSVKLLKSAKPAGSKTVTNSESLIEPARLSLAVILTVPGINSRYLPEGVNGGDFRFA